MKYSIVEFDPGTAPEHLLEKSLDFEDRIFREREPEDPLPLREYRRESIRGTNPRRKVLRWVVTGDVYDKQEVIGKSKIAFVTEKDTDYEAYGHIAKIDLEVDERFRRRGIGTELLGLLVQKAVEEGSVRTIETFSFQESGWRFCAKFGGRLALEAAQHRLNLAKVDWALMEAWRCEGAKRNEARGTKLRSFQAVPEEMLEEFVDLCNEIVDGVPLGELEMRVRVTPASRREAETRMGGGWYTMVSRETDGSLSGLTEVVHDPAMPYRVEQELTGVRDLRRGRGLGKWLKAEMVFFIRDQLPEARYINTGNADTNAAMVSINERMGFKRHQTERCFRFDLEALDRLLFV
jgi:GNAT superfamily N-acetyltransferase